MGYLGKRILVTGHTGFKGSWLTIWLQKMGAIVDGLSLPGVVSEPNLYTIADIHTNRDIRLDLSEQRYWPSDFFDGYDVVFHLAAQPIVSEAYRKPAETFYANTVGTLNLLEGIRTHAPTLKVVVVTTDKVYKDTTKPCSESDSLQGYEPYSCSKVAVESIVHAYAARYDMQISVGRAGNCIGGGDWGHDRLFPDLVRAFDSGKHPEIRNHNGIRPWQHVLEPLYGYLLLGEKPRGVYNFGPKSEDERSVDDVLRYARLCWGETKSSISGTEIVGEANTLRLDSSAAKAIGWGPRWYVEKAIEKTIEGYKAYYRGYPVRVFMESQIDEYMQ